MDKSSKARKNELLQLLDDADLTDEDWKQEEEEEPVPRREAEASSGEEEEAKSKLNGFCISLTDSSCLCLSQKIQSSSSQKTYHLAPQPLPYSTSTFHLIRSKSMKCRCFENDLNLMYFI